MVSTYNGIVNNTHEKWWRDPGLRRNIFWIGWLILLFVIGGYDGSLLNGFQALPAFQETFPRLFSDPNLLGIAGASQFLPGFIFCPIGAILSDKYGRKLPLICLSVLIVVGAIIQATTSTVELYILSRVIIGTGTSLGGPVGPAAISELAHPRFRAVACALYLCSYHVGSIIASWTTYGTLLHMSSSAWSWRLPALLQGAVPLLTIVPYIMMPQSPRWLVSKGRKEEAHRVLATLHANGDMQDPLVVHQMAEIEGAINEEFEQNQHGWKGLVATKANRHRLTIAIIIGVGAQWAGNGIIAYYLVPILRTIGITNSIDATMINGGMAISNMMFSVAGALCVERVGRRPLWLLSTGGMLGSFITVTALSARFAVTAVPGLGVATIAFLYIFYGFYCIAWTPLAPAYTAEILPFSIRSKGLAVWQLANMTGLVVNTWVNPIALQAIQWKYYLVYIGILSFLLVVIYFYFPETKGLTLEEINIRFEGASDSTGSTELGDDPESKGEIAHIDHPTK